MSNSNFLIIQALSSQLKKSQAYEEIVSDRNLYKIVLVTQGTVCLKIGDQNYDIKSPSLYFIAPGQISQLISHSPEVEGFCISFDIDYFLLCLKNQVQLCFYPFFQFNQYPLLPLNNAECQKIQALVQKIAIEYNSRHELNDDLLTKLYLNILLIEIERFYKLKSGTEQQKQSRKGLITAKFKQLVEKNFLLVRKVSEYADLLSIAPNYLNDIVKETTRQSASEIIHERLTLEAKAQLIQTELSINEIAYQLQFNDSSYFCRFFRKQTGVSPQVFRKSNHF